MLKRRWFILTLILVFNLLFLFLTTTTAAPVSEIQLAFIDVGQGDSALISDTDGFHILIDGGDTDAGPAVLAYLRLMAVDDIDVMVATHADSDHIGGLIDVLQATDIPVEQVLYNGYPGETDTWDQFAQAVTDEGLTLLAAQFPMTLTWGVTTAHILNPAPGLVKPETNDASVVILLEHREMRFLFTGDIDSSIEATVVARGTPVAADILKVGHHGSLSSSSAEFLQAVGAQEGAISVGDNNDYGHPAPETLARLAAAGVRALRTDQLKTIVFASDGYSYRLLKPLLDGQPVFLPVLVRNFPAPIGISQIFFDGVVSSQEPDEFVEFQNLGGEAIQLAGWTLQDGDDPARTYTFPDYQIQPGETCRVYTNEVHPEFCGFSFASASAIWGNSGDCAYIKDATGGLVASSCYP